VEDDAGGADAYISSAKDNRDAAFKITDSTAYLRLSEFSELTMGHFNAWRLTVLSNIPNIVIDLRDNGGGRLDVTDSIVGEFVPAGSQYISTRQRAYDSRKHEGHTIEWTNMKNAKKPGLGNKNISVIMDRWSASAAEILAAALKDCANAHLVGERSYGKGMGQVIIPRMDKKTLRITFMEIRGVPGGEVGDYHRTGIPPDRVDTDLSREARRLCPIDTNLYNAVKLLEGSAPADSIQSAANYIQKNSLLRKSAGRIGAYVLADEDIFE
jgi:C-terminal peptidase prc